MPNHCQTPDVAKGKLHTELPTATVEKKIALDAKFKRCEKDKFQLTNDCRAAVLGVHTATCESLV
jgi:hypothetical protein